MVVFIHLSDIHIKSASDPILAKANEISATTFSYLPSASHVFIIVSGDVAFSGQASEYALAKQFLVQLRECLKAESALPVTFVIAPGNHDCDFKQNSGARKLLLKQIADSDLSEVDDSVIQTCTAVQSEFFRFRDLMEQPENVDDDKLWRTQHFQIGDRTILIDSLNLSWSSQLDEEPGRIYFPVDRYDYKKQNIAANVRILVMHHPLNWFGQSVYRPFRSFVRQLADILVTGHEHQGNVGINDDAESEKNTYMEGCVLQPDNKKLTNSSFNVISIDLESSQFSATKFTGMASDMNAQRKDHGRIIANCPLRVKVDLASIRPSRKLWTIQVHFWFARGKISR